jgi:hypothetical protein
MPGRWSAAYIVQRRRQCRLSAWQQAVALAAPEISARDIHGEIIPLHRLEPNCSSLVPVSCIWHIVSSHAHAEFVRGTPVACSSTRLARGVLRHSQPLAYRRRY